MNAMSESNVVVTTGVWDVKPSPIRVIITGISDHRYFDTDQQCVRYKVVHLNGDVVEFEELVPRGGDFELPLVAKEDAK